MMLEKLTIKPLSNNLKEIKVLFNPTSYSISKSVTWNSPTLLGNRIGKEAETTDRGLDAPTLVFGGGGSRILTLRLFFDVTEHPIINGNPVLDVRELTNRFVELTRIERKGGTPPVCEITWGSQTPHKSDFPFKGVVTGLEQEFTLFESDGRPVRANLTVTFKEFLKPEENKRETDPEFTTRLIKRGDSLSSIAAEVYNDPSLWRIIAHANNLDDPRRLVIGLALNIPKLR